MQRRTYTIEQSQTLELTWEASWKSLTVYLDGEKIGSVPDQEALMEGQTFPLPDDSTLTIQLTQNASTYKLQVTHNGIALRPDSTFNLPIAAFLLGVINALLGLLSVIYQEPFLQDANIGMRSIIFGIIWMASGALMRRRAALAMTLTFGLWFLDCAIAYFLMVSEHGWMSPRAGIPSNILIRTALLFIIILGTKAAFPPKKLSPKPA